MSVKSLIGDRAFYRRVAFITFPILIQNVITNFVGLIDNIMVGSVGTEQMSGVAIVNQLLFVFNICIFGGLSGPGIFTAQYFGKGDHKGVYDCTRSGFVNYAVTSRVALPQQGARFAAILCGTLNSALWQSIQGADGGTTSADGGHTARLPLL